MDVRYNKTLALAGVMQAASLVNQVAFNGRIKETDCYKASINSAFKSNEERVSAIYGSLKGLCLGLNNLELYLKKQKSQANFNYQIRYLKQINLLAKIMDARPEMGSRIAESIRSNNNYTSDAKTIENLAKIYYENFSSLPANRRILVMGDKKHLQSKKNILRIRALLFAGIRAAFLWRSYGGGMLSLLLQKNYILREIQEIKQII